MNKGLTKQSTTVLGEHQRKAGIDSSRVYFKSNTKYGVVSEVHPTLYAVRVLLDGGGLAQGGEFIPVANAWQQLIHDFGNLRPGLLIELTYTGDQESSSTAKVIGLEKEGLAQLQQEPEIDLALYEIFSPGV